MGHRKSALELCRTWWQSHPDRFYRNLRGGTDTQAATREPDFFELLQAGIILPSSVDDEYHSPDSTLLPVDHQRSKMLHILTIGANLIAQSRADSYPVRIACLNVGGTRGDGSCWCDAFAVPELVSDLLRSLDRNFRFPRRGGINWLLVPNLWDPFRDTWDLTEAKRG